MIQFESTFAEDAGITLDDAPSPLFQLLVVCMLQAKPIKAAVAVDAARGLFAAGLTTPEALRDCPRSRLIRIFGQTGYKRYDESTATRLHAMAEKVCAEFGGDIRAVRDGAPDSLTVFDGVGPACATMFAREAQGVWPELAPTFDKKALQGAKKLGLPTEQAELAELSDDLPRLAATLVKAALS